MSLAGRRALVTGGGRGIGRAVSARLKAQGAHVAILGRDAARLDEAVAAGDADAALPCDVTDEAAMSRAVAELENGTAFDIVIANAGAAETAPFARSDAALFRRMIEVNLIGTSNLFRAALPAMTDTGYGRLIAIASTAGHRGYPYVSAYVAAKHAVVGLVRSLALENARRGITVNAICPGYTETDLGASAVGGIVAKTGMSRQDALSQLVAANPQRRLIAPAEIAHAVLMLCQPGSEGITGQSIMINGGEF